MCAASDPDIPATGRVARLLESTLDSVVDEVKGSSPWAFCNQFGAGVGETGLEPATPGPPDQYLFRARDSVFGFEWSVQEMVGIGAAPDKWKRLESSGKRWNSTVDRPTFGSSRSNSIR
jgi:hypothetical protein